MKGKPLTPEQAAEASMLRNQNCKFWTYAELGRRYNVSHVAVYYAINAEARKKRAERWRIESQGITQTEFRVSTAELMALFRMIPPDTRDLTGRLLGDPIPGDPRRRLA